MPSAAPGPVLIGIDIGTSSVKAVMAGPGGKRLDAVAAAHETARPAPGRAEQDAPGWLALVEAALARFAAHPAARRVAAIGITSQVNTHVFCDGALNPLCPAITWADTRAAAHAARLEGAIAPAAKVAALGAPIPIDASHALARMAWIEAERADIWAATAHVMAPKDFVIARLTGAVAADPLSSVGLVGTNHAYAEAVLDLVPRARALLPPLRDPLEVVGRMAPGRPFAGVPVCAGTMDAWASMFGLGVATEGAAFYLSGTSEVLGVVAQARTGAGGVVTFPDWRGIRLHAAPTQAGGASLAWLARITGRAVEDLAALGGDVRISAQSPLFLPHLEGERAPLWDPIARGAFAGLSSADGPAEIAAAVMEGVAFSARLALEALEASAGQPVTALRLGGGGAASDAWCRIRADALGRRLERVAAREAGATGAFVMAGVAAGVLGDLAEATAALVATDARFDPDPAAAALADARFARFRAFYAALGPVNRGFAAG
jgi:xylulokinase